MGKRKKSWKFKKSKVLFSQFSFLFFFYVLVFLFLMSSDHRHPDDIGCFGLTGSN